MPIGDLEAARHSSRRKTSRAILEEQPDPIGFAVDVIVGLQMQLDNADARIAKLRERIKELETNAKE